MKSLSNTRCFLLDMDGTFNIGERLIEGSLRFIDVLREQGRDFLFLTNNSSHNQDYYVRKITRLGLPLTREKIFTSSEATAIYLWNTYPAAKLYLVGTPELQAEFSGWGFDLVEQDPDVLVLGFDTTLTYEKLWKLCDGVRAGLPFIATHPDFNCPTENGFMPDVGAMLAFVKASTGREPDAVIGKPNRLMVEAICQKLNLPVEALAMVGDRLYTDIALGQTTGIATVLVLSGETSRGDLENSPFQPDYVFENLGGLADYLQTARD
jgi:HAD superfamily hydrolase (TIGR01450 family)